MNLTRLLSLSVLASCLVLSACSSAEKDEKNEVAVTMNDVPPAVKATLDRESAGGKVTEVEKEVKDGKTIYSADMMINGVAWDIAVAEDGTVISKEKEK